MHMRLAALSAALLLMGAGCFGSANVNTNVQATPEGTETVVENNDDGRMMAGCHFDDKNLCRFWTSWEASSDMTVRMTTTGKDGKVSNIVMELDGDTNSHMTMSEGGKTGMETIQLDMTTYVKGEDGVWTKFGSGTPGMDVEAPNKNEGIHFDLSDEDTSKTTFVSMGTEACGGMTCFKYEITESGMSGRQYIWFDNKEFKLRKTQYEDAELGVTVAEYSYGDVTITAPSPVKELSMPGFQGMPSQAEIDAMMKAQFGAEAGN